jgi:Bifunctional DNA primase/polymerase, N-terminal
MVDQKTETINVDNIANAALQLFSDHRFPIVPLYGTDENGVCLCYKRVSCPKKNPGKHPVGEAWQNKIPLTESDLSARLAGIPGCNIGVKLGPPISDSLIGLVDFEFDEKEKERAQAAEKKYFDGIHTWKYTSRSGLPHRLFRWHPSLAALNQSSTTSKASNAVLVRQGVPNQSFRRHELAASDIAG